jgi:hypothetical protein
VSESAQPGVASTPEKAAVPLVETPADPVRLAPRRAVPMRAVPCVDTADAVTPDAGHADPIALTALDAEPVVCGGTTCLRLDGVSATVVDAPSAPSLPLGAAIRAVDDHPAACRDTTCKPLGPRLRAAVDLEAQQDEPVLEATFDLSTVVVGTQVWSVGRDRPLVLQRPRIGRWEGIGQVSVVGELLLVRWDGACIDSMCEISQLVDRHGRERGWVKAHGRVLRLDDRQFVTISEFSVMEVRDLYTGKATSSLDPAVSQSDFIDAVRLDDHRFAVLRQLGDGVHVEIFEVWYGQLLGQFKVHLPACEA